jgi:signal transduction histidine kinase
MPGLVASRRERAWALGLALLASIALLVISQTLLAWMTGSVAGLRLAPAAVVLAGLTAAAHLVFLVMSARTGPIDQAAELAVRALVVAPPLAFLVVVPLMWGAALFATSIPALLPQIGPLLCAVWAAALFVTPIAAALLRRIAPMDRSPPDEVASRWTGLLGACVAATALVALGHALARGLEAPPPASLGHLTLLLGLAVLVALVALAGVTLGAAGSGEVVAIARRLERVDIDSEQPAGRPLVVTRLDRMGELMAELEQLRRDLGAEHQRYQDTLAQTREAAVAKAEFLAAVSHELRTPLNSICGFSQLLLEGMPRDLAAEQQEDVRLIRTSGMQLLGLINDILDISMIESGELRLYFAPEDIADIIDEVARIHRPLVQQVGVELRAEVPDGLPRVVCDRRRISQILNNLLSNATKFTERGSITVSAAYDPLAGRLLVRVADTGIGIASEDTEAIFNEYHQVGSLSQRKQGTGLGLAIARSIAIHHGGSLGVSSALGRGSAFTLALPLDPPRKPTSIDMTAEVVRASQRMRQPRMLALPEVEP